MFEYLSCAFKRIELPQKWRSCSSRAGMRVMNFAVNSKKEEVFRSGQARKPLVQQQATGQALAESRTHRYQA